MRDYGTTLVDLARTLEWDYVRVPTMPVDCAGHLWYGAVWSRGLEYLLVAMRPDLGPRYRIQ